MDFFSYNTWPAGFWIWPTLQSQLAVPMSTSYTCSWERRSSDMASHHWKISLIPLSLWSWNVQALLEFPTQNNLKTETNLPPRCCSASSWWEPSEKCHFVDWDIAETLLSESYRSSIKKSKIPPTNYSQFPVLSGNITRFGGSYLFPGA